MFLEKKKIILVNARQIKINKLMIIARISNNNINMAQKNKKIKKRNKK